jgi:MraZ protein
VLWDEVGYNSSGQAGPGWRGSSHSASPDRLSPLPAAPCALPFHGIHDHTLDSKNRLTVPSKARALLANGATVSKGFERCLQVWPSEEHTVLVNRAMANVNPFDPRARDLNRFFYGGTTTQELDSAGRISISPEQLAHAGISKAVKVVGAGPCLELWDEDTWNEHNTDLHARAAELIQDVGNPA